MAESILSLAIVATGLGGLLLATEIERLKRRVAQLERRSPTPDDEQG